MQAPDAAAAMAGSPRIQAGPVAIRTMVALSAAVLAVHIAILRAAPGAVNLDAPSPVHKFITRTITINPPADDAPSPTQPVPPTHPPAPPVARPRIVQAAPASPPVDMTAPAPDTTAAPPQAPLPAPAPATVAQPASAPAPPAPPARRDDTPRATAFTIPGSIKLNYNVVGEVKKQTWNARGELLWRHDGSQYDARSEVSAFLAGSRTQTSTGRLTQEGLAPTRFADKSKTELAAHFDRDKGRVVFSANTPELPLLAGEQDRLSVILQLGAMIAGEPSRYPPSTTITLQTVGPRDADAWLFTVEGEEKLALPGGEMQALKLTRNPRRDFDIKVELWLAPALGYLPARMRLTQQNGDFVDQQLRSTDKP